MLGHIRRFDCPLKYLLLFCLCLNWYNPVVWIMEYCAQRDIELACDEAVLYRLGGDRRRPCAMTLLDLIHVQTAPPLSSGFGKSATEERIQAIMKTKRIPAAVTVLVLLAVVSLLAAVAVQAAPSVKTASRTEETAQAEPAAPAGPSVKSSETQPAQAETAAQERESVSSGSAVSKTAQAARMWVFPLEQTKPEILCPFSTFVHPVYGYTARHNGVDPAADEGDAILAVSDGAVTEAAFSEIYGNYILIEHQNGYVSQYQHCSALYVQKGDSVLRGQQIAAVGQTGWVTDSHLHLSILKDGEAIDPMVLLG